MLRSSIYSNGQGLRKKVATKVAMDVLSMDLTMAFTSTFDRRGRRMVLIIDCPIVAGAIGKITEFQQQQILQDKKDVLTKTITD